MKIVVGLLLVTSLSGCGTILNLTVGADTGAREGGVVFDGYYSNPVFHTQVYGGLKNDADLIEMQAEAGGWSLLLIPLLLVDLPLSFAGDTVTLLYTVPCVLTRGNTELPQPKLSPR
jgi:uncharacterized protein YceK